MTDTLDQIEMWVPRQAQALPPPLTPSERLMVDRLVAAEVRAARAEEALRWARKEMLSQQRLVDDLLAEAAA